MKARSVGASTNLQCGARSSSGCFASPEVNAMQRMFGSITQKHPLETSDMRGWAKVAKLARLIALPLGIVNSELRG